MARTRTAKPPAVDAPSAAAAALRSTAPAGLSPTVAAAGIAPARAMLLPAAFTLILIGLSFVPSVRANQHLQWSFWGAAVMLFAAGATLAIVARQAGRRLTIEVVLRKQHYFQACAHISILLYWGWYWREVYHAAPLIAGQLAFAFAFDALLCWSRRDTYTLGFGPFPIIFSTNLFLWFKADWFYLQFLMVAVGFAAKELIRWERDGRRTHVFNPSSFTLMLFSAVLLTTGRTGISWGPEIASTQLNPPHIYLWIFLASLPGQFLFGVAPMTWAAVSTAYVTGGVYFAATGMHFFPERPIPVAVFLGMHLLFTDPSTAPRSELGRLIFGILYGLSVVGLLALLTFLDLPTFYDKLLPVPILNLLIQRIDRLARSSPLKRLDPAALGRTLLPRRRNLAYIALWTATFITMVAVTGSDGTLVRADSLFSQGRVDEAIERYREFVAANPSNFEGHNNLGVALMQQRRFDDAVVSFARASALRPASARTLDNLGLALTGAGRGVEAIEPGQRAAAIEPGSAEISDHLGQALMQARRWSDALASFNRAVALSPSSAQAEDDRGVALMEMGRFEDAVAALRRAVDLSPLSADVQNNLGVALLRAGKPADAAAPLQRAVDLDRANSGALDNLGQALLQAGRSAAAVAVFRRAAEVQPASVDAANNLGVALMQDGQVDAALEVLRRVADLEPDNPQPQTNLAAALLRAGRTDDAVAVFRHMVDLQPASADAQNGLGRTLLRAGRLAEARAALQQAIALSPVLIDARYNLAQLFAATGSNQAASAQLREALRLQPNALEPLLTLAWIEATDPHLRDAADALRLATQAVELTGQRNANALDVLGAAYAASGRDEDAADAARAALALAVTAGDQALAAQVKARLEVYESRQGKRK